MGEADPPRLLEHADRRPLARHAAPAAARGLARRVDPWQARPELLVGRELVEETALQPSAVAQQPVVGERHVLGLRHPHGDRLEAPEVGRAAELAAARPDAVHELGRVARADLAHLDPRVELACDVADQLAEVDAVLGIEVDGDTARRRLHLDVHHLHREPSSARQLLAGDDRPLLALAALAVLAGLRRYRQAHHAAVQAVALGPPGRTAGPPGPADPRGPPPPARPQGARPGLPADHLVVVRLRPLGEPDP